MKEIEDRGRKIAEMKAKITMGVFGWCSIALFWK
jgi:hypothetical protein